MNNEQRLDDEALLRELYKLNMLILYHNGFEYFTFVGTGLYDYLLHIRSEVFLMACEKGAYGSIT